MDRYKGIIKPPSEGSNLTILQIVLIQPDGELNLRKFKFFDWFIKPVENFEKYFVAMFSESYVISDSCIVDSIEIYTPDGQDSGSLHTPDELFNRMYSYCKSSLDTTQNAIKLQRPKVKHEIRYALSRQKTHDPVPGTSGMSKYWQYYKPISKSWSLNCLDVSVRRCSTEREFIDFLDTIPPEVISKNELYVSKLISSGNGIKTEHCKIQEFLVKNFN